MSERFGPAALGFYGLAARMLGWRPPEFWAATPAELVAALSPPGAPASLDRDTLNRMMELQDG
jgi:hypothetical protein